uniref:Hypothetical chloroplast protein RF1 n=1 Tax=Rotundella rotunda TaxID=1357779 RepID=A0A140GIH0_9CHLO|nr:hypothetical chloroplast protein RF1 [Rotundella rotunda]
MYTLFSLVTSVKDYIEVVHKLIETDPNLNLTTYYDFGATTTFVILAFKQIIAQFLSLSWFQTIWSLPTLVPDIAASMISEISVLDGSFHNTLTLFETPLSYGNTNMFFYCMEKFMIGFVNSFFLCFPTSIAHIITLRRFVMQGLEAGYISGLGTIAGNLVWIGSIVFGLRFIVIPWLSLDLLRYLLGFLLLIKYMWDSYTEKRTVLEDLSKWKIFLLTFLLSFCEQTNLSPFLSNLSIGSDATPFESFPTQTFFEFVSVHGCYLTGLFVGSFSLLQFTLWFWENPAFNLYMWFIRSFKVTTSFYHKLLNLTFLYITMICAVSNMSYFGIDYTITHPLGMVHEDRLVDQKMFLETAFLNSKASDRNTRRNRGRHGRRERWKRRVRRYRTFDASLYDQGVYDLFTIEDLNYGFDRFWLRRKLRNHRVRFRFFPGPWMRSFKKQLSRPRLESSMGPRVEFFRILFEQAYHPSFHEFRNKKGFSGDTNKTSLNNKYSSLNASNSKVPLSSLQSLEAFNGKKKILSIYSERNGERTGAFGSTLMEDLRKEQSALRKFVRKVNSRIQFAKIRNEIETASSLSPSALPSVNSVITSANLKASIKPIYSKRWKYLFSKMAHPSKSEPKYTKSEDHLFQRFKKNTLWKNEKKGFHFINYFEKKENRMESLNSVNTLSASSLASAIMNKEGNFTKKEDVKKHLSLKDRQILRYKTFLTNKEKTKENEMYRPMTLLHPMKFYLQKDQAFKRKLSFYGVKPFRNFGVENNAPYFRIMMKRFFYYYKPTLRWERTMRVATLRKARRKGPRIPRKRNVAKTTEALSFSSNNTSLPSLGEREEKGSLGERVSSLGRKQAFLSFSSTNKEEAKEMNTSLIQKPTHFYSLVSKRASRYRFQIYKDVLQHWYYTPLNRLLLKFDVDSFIRRQPKTYFLTKKEEKLLHLKRTLLSEYYETLRWYTYMQHARTMKANIGGTKSLSSRAYNQQFQGTFKKIRHLFAITPSSTDYTVLKFDQPLFNEYSNDTNDSIVEDSVVHEELFADEAIYKNPFSASSPSTSPSKMVTMTKAEDLPNQSAKILREYLLTSTPLRQELIRKLVSEKQYWEFTQFLFKGQKLRGTKPITNKTDFLNQEKAYLLSSAENRAITDFKTDLWEKEYPLWSLSTKVKESKLSSPSFVTLKEGEIKDGTYTFGESVKGKSNLELWMALLKKAQNTLYDQESLKNYVSGRVEKHERQKQRQQKKLKARLERMQQWFVEKKKTKAFYTIKTSSSPTKKVSSNYSGLTSSIQKALKDGFFWEKGWTSPKFNIRNNRPNFYKHLDAETSTSSPINSLLKRKVYNLGMVPSEKSIFLKDHLKDRVMQNALQTLSAEQDLRNRFSDIQQDVKGRSENLQSIFQSVKKEWNRIQYTFFKPFVLLVNQSERLLSYTSNALFFSQYGNQPLKDGSSPSPSKMSKSLVNWRQREIALSKRKKIRKTLKRLRNKTSIKERPWISSKNQPEDFINYALKSGTFTSPLKKSFGRKSILFGEKASFPSSLSSKETKTEREGQRKKRDFLFGGSPSNMSSSTFPPTGEKVTKGDREEESLLNTKNKKDWTLFLRSQTFLSSLNAGKEFSKVDEKPNLLNQIFKNSFKRKRTRLRRSRRFKARSPIQKSTLGEKFKRQFRLLKKYRQTENQGSALFLSKENRKVEIIQQITKRKYDPQSEFQRNETKQRRTRQRKHRFWKKHKKQKYATNRRQLRHQRRRYALNKIRVLNKKLYRIHGNVQMKQWWWQTFLPNFQANKDALWEIQKNKQMKEELSKLSVSEILERDQAFFLSSSHLSSHISPSTVVNSMRVNENGEPVNTLNNEKTQVLQIGDKDYKPLAIPEALRIREKLVQKQLLNFGSDSFHDDRRTKENEKRTTFLSSLSSLSSKEKKEKKETKEDEKEEKLFFKGEKLSSDLIGQISQKLFEEGSTFGDPSTTGEETYRTTRKFQQFYEQDSSKFMVGTNPMPFYTGWDESLRKFVVTNRFLSRKEAGYLMNLSPYKKRKTSPSLNPFNTVGGDEVKAPLQGMNAATTLYWQIPFTTYDPDQFFALGMDGFSPIAWKNFHFKHSKQTTRPILVKNVLSTLNPSSSFNGSPKVNLSPSSSSVFTIENGEIKKSREKTKSSLKTFRKTKLSYDLRFKMLSSRFKPKKVQNLDFNTFKIHQYRRIQKRQKRLKKHPRPPVWFPSGPLTNQVLPVHYIYVFYKRSRLPRDRYIRRRLRRTPHVDMDQQLSFVNLLDKNHSSEAQGSSLNSSYELSTIKDYTLRRRSKPRRKYHRKRQKSISPSLMKENFFLKRRAFRALSFYDINEKDTEIGNNDLNPNKQRFRPLSKIQATSVLSSKRTAFKSKASSSAFSTFGESDEKRNREKNAKEANRKSAKQSSENLRVRQLRRRIQRQVLRPISRYKPRAGGLVWPGDYLRFEAVKAPKLQTSTLKLSLTEQKSSFVEEKGKILFPTKSENFVEPKNRKIRKKKRKMIQEWQIQPKQYLLQKHNIKVLKKRLEKSQNRAQMHQKVQQFKYLWNNE